MNKYLLSSLCSLCVGLILNPLDASASLDFNCAVERATKASLGLQISQTEIQLKEAEREQVGFYPNPILSYEIENFAGNRKWRGFKGAESRYAVSQIIETGGKRASRQQLASYQYDMAVVNYEINQIKLLNQLNRAFVEVFAAQEQWQLALEQKQIAEEMLEITRCKIQAGKLSIREQLKGEILCSSAELEAEQAWTHLEVAKDKLASLWQGNGSDFGCVDYLFYDIACPPTLESYEVNLSNHPALIYARLNALAAYAISDLEKSMQVPDVTVTLGYKTDEEIHARGLMLGVAVPLPIFDRNLGNIKRAQVEIYKSQYEEKLVGDVLRTKLSMAYKELMQAYQEILRFRETVLKCTYRTFDLVQEGYTEGKFECLELLDVQKTFFEVKKRYIDRLLNYHLKKADIDYLSHQID